VATRATCWEPKPILRHRFKLSAFFINIKTSLYFLQVQHALKKSEKALDTLNKAIVIDPKNPLCKFHRASVLFANEKYKVRFISVSSTLYYVSLKKKQKQSEEMAQQLRALTLLEVLSSNPSNHLVAHNHL
jgi:hypothetical protein